MIRKYEGDTSLGRNGGCSLCRTVANLVTTDDSIEGEGLYLLCRGCIHDLAEAAGFLVDSRDEVMAQEQLLNDLSDRLQTVLSERDRAEEKLRTLRETWVEAVAEREGASIAEAVGK